MNKEAIKATQLGLIILNKRMKSSLTSTKSDLNFRFINKVNKTKKNWTPKPFALVCASTLVYSLYHLLNDQKEATQTVKSSSELSNVRKLAIVEPPPISLYPSNWLNSIKNEDINSRAKTIEFLNREQVIDPKKTIVIFVLGTCIFYFLGGPGAGKGTQCSKIVKEFDFVHLSAGDLLRLEMQRPGSEYGELIQNFIKEGNIVPMEITIALLKKAMISSGKNRFLIDGFPRKMDQAVKFEETVCPSKSVLYFECPQEVMLNRLIKRGETSGRTDDNIESIKKRFTTFEKTSKPVIEKFSKDHKVFTINCVNRPDDVYEHTRKAVLEAIENNTHKNI